jgi:hypothetical protein
VRFRHRLDRIRDQLATREGIAHPFVSHGDAIADPDCVELKRRPSGTSDSGLDRICNPVEMRMSGHDLVVGVRYAD